MAIIGAFSGSSIVEGPFCDYLNVTVSKDSSELVLRDIWSLLPSVGAYTELDEGLVSFFDPLTTKPIGTLRARPRGRVCVISASGGFLRLLRDRGLFSEYLGILGSYPHRVSMLHATADFAVDSPPSVIASVKAAAQAGELALTRKRLDPSQCTYLLGNDHEGYETGTVYLGKRQNADVWAKCYDKRHERISRGFSDPGPIVRIEVAVQSDMGATLRDAFDPFSIFFQFAGKTLCAAPPEFTGWVPHGEGYALPPKQDREPAERLARMVEFSHDIGRIIELAVSEFGDSAAEMISREIRLRIARTSGLIP